MFLKRKQKKYSKKIKATANKLADKTFIDCPQINELAMTIVELVGDLTFPIFHYEEDGTQRTAAYHVVTHINAGWHFILHYLPVGQPSEILSAIDTLGDTAAELYNSIPFNPL